MDLLFLGRRKTDAPSTDVPAIDYQVTDNLTIHFSVTNDLLHSLTLTVKYEKLGIIYIEHSYFCLLPLIVSKAKA